MIGIPTHVLDVIPDDPLEALIEVEKHIRPNFDSVEANNQIGQVETYWSTIKQLCFHLGIPFSIQSGIDMSASSTEAENLLYQTITFVESKKVELLAAKRKTKLAGVLLNQSWKDRIHSYISKIRDIVKAAEVQQASRETILAKLNELGAEVDKERTSIQKFSDVFIALCEAVSTGAKKLEPAIRLIERITGAVSAASKEQPRLELPAPDQLRLPAPPSKDDSSPDDTSDA